MNMWAKYNGILYDASLKSETEVIIRTIKKSEADDNFFTKNYPDGTPVYIKYVPKTELEELYEEHEYGTYKEIEFYIIDENSDTYTLSFTYENYKLQEKEIKLCKSLGFVEIDRTVFEKKVPKSDVTNYRIEKEDILHK